LVSLYYENFHFLAFYEPGEPPRSVSSKARGKEKSFFVEVLMTGSTLGVYSNFLAVPGEEPSPVSASFILGALDKRMVVGFLSEILPTTREMFRDCVKNWMNIYKL
jgi:hypothetical protein